MSPAVSSRTRGTLKAVAIGSVAAGVLVAGAVIGVFFYVGHAIDRAALSRKLTFKYGSASFPTTQLTISGVTISPRRDLHVVFRTPRMVVDIAGLRPSRVSIPIGVLALEGGAESIRDTVLEVRDADAKLPMSERVPVTVLGGSLDWKAPLGEGTSIEFRKMTAELIPQAGTSRIDLESGRGALGMLTLTPLHVKIVNTSSDDSTEVSVALSPRNADRARVELRQSSSGTDITVWARDLRVSDVAEDERSLGMWLVKWLKARVDGDVSVQRSAKGAVRSKGRVAVAQAAVVPISIGPISVSVGGVLEVNWSADPKKGHPGVATIHEGRLTGQVAGVARTLTFSGDVSAGTEARGPYVVDLQWKTEAIACRDVASQFVGRMAGGLATGTLVVQGTLRGNVGRPRDMKLTTNLVENCGVSVPLLGDVGGLVDLAKKVTW